MPPPSTIANSISSVGGPKKRNAAATAPLRRESGAEEQLGARKRRKRGEDAVEIAVAASEAVAVAVAGETERPSPAIPLTC